MSKEGNIVGAIPSLEGIGSISSSPTIFELDNENNPPALPGYSKENAVLTTPLIIQNEPAIPPQENNLSSSITSEKEALQVIEHITLELQAAITQNDPESLQKQKSLFEEKMKEITEHFGQSSELKTALLKLDQLFKKHSYQLHQVYQARDLARWEHYTLKLDLCKEAELLQGTPDHELPAAAKKLKQLRLRWKNIGSVPHEKAQEVWDHFRGNCDALQQRISLYYDTINERRQEIAKDKILICEAAEAIKDSTEWEPTAAQFKELQKQWREVGFTHPEQERELYKRFRAACDVFFDARKEFYCGLKLSRDESLKIKLNLCEEAKQIFTLSYGDAHKLIPSLWERWKAAGSAGKEDRVLYEEFRGTFDQYYQDLRVMRANNLEQKKELITKFEELFTKAQEAQEANEDYSSALLQEYELLQNSWHEVGPMPRAEEQPILDAYRQITHSFRKLNEKMCNPQSKKYIANSMALEQLLGKSLESAYSDDNETLEAYIKEWEAICLAEKQHFDPLFQKLIATTQDSDKSALHEIRNNFDSNLKNREAICEELEAMKESNYSSNTNDLAEELSSAIADNFASGIDKKIKNNKSKQAQIKELAKR